MVRSCVTLLKIRNGSEYWALARNLLGRKSGIFGRSSFREDRLPAGSSLEKSGDATMGAVGSTRSSLSIELSGDHGVVGYYVCAHLRRRRYFLWRFEKYLEELTGPWIWE